VRELVEAARGDDGIGAVGAKILRYDQPDRIWFDGGVFDRTRAIGHHLRENDLDANPAERTVSDVSFLTGCCLLIPAATLRRAGYFRDEFFCYTEDVEYGLRLINSGLRLAYAPAARLRHRVPPAGTPPSPAQIRLRDRNRRRIVRLHYSRMHAAIFAIWYYPTRIASMIRYVAQGEWERAKAVWRGMTDA